MAEGTSNRASHPRDVRAMYLLRQENANLRGRVRVELEALREWADDQGDPEGWPGQVSQWAQSRLEKLTRTTT